jgi:hypothetical protein
VEHPERIDCVRLRSIYTYVYIFDVSTDLCWGIVVEALFFCLGLREWGWEDWIRDPKSLKSIWVDNSMLYSLGSYKILAFSYFQDMFRA